MISEAFFVFMMFFFGFFILSLFLWIEFGFSETIVKIMWGIMLALSVIVGDQLLHQSEYQVEKQEIVIIDNIATTKDLINANTVFGKNFTSEETIYKVTIEPYWYHGFYWYQFTPDYYIELPDHIK